MVGVTAVLMVVGMVGIVIPVLPGLFLVWGSVLAWALVTRTSAGWVILGVCTVWYAVGLVTQYLVPGRRLRTAGLQTRTLVLALILGIVGFFVIPVLGGPLGFVGGIYLAEYARTREPAATWSATKEALRAVALSMGIELGAGFAIAATWIVGLFLTR